MIKLIASDIDGTLVKDGTLAIDREYMEVIGRLIDKGIVFVACSGRQYRSERKLFTPVADRLLYISDGGTVVRTPKEILKVDTLPDEICKNSPYRTNFRNLERNVFYGKREYAFL